MGVESRAEQRRVTGKGLLCTGSHLDLARIMKLKEYRQEVNQSSFNSGLYHLILSKHLLTSTYSRIPEHLFHSPVCTFVKKTKASWSCKENSENRSHEIFI